jgi:hypothetical protein
MIGESVQVSLNREIRDNLFIFIPNSKALSIKIEGFGII